jgi:hypothetical protein
VSEARTGKRFPLQLPTRIHTCGSTHEHLGLTNDLSAAGVYILAGSEFEVGAVVDFEIALPEELAGGRVRLRCRGRVVRIEPSAPQNASALGVACVIDSYELVRDSEGQGRHDAEADHS